MASPVQRPVPKFAPKVALVQLDSPTSTTLARAFAQYRVQTVSIAEDFRSRFTTEQFQGCVLNLGDDAGEVLEAVRSSRSNNRMILYGLLSNDVDVRRFSKYGINALLDRRLDRNAVLNTVRSTCALLLHELRRYIRIPLVVEVSVESGHAKLSGVSREISGGGMSVELAKPAQLSGSRLAFALPNKPSVTIGATTCWQNGTLTGFKFESSDPARQAVKDWINSFLGLD